MATERNKVEKIATKGHYEILQHTGKRQYLKKNYKFKKKKKKKKK